MTEGLVKIVTFLMASLIPLISLATPPGELASRKFPRLFGMNIGEKNYQDDAYLTALEKLDVVVLGFYKGWHKGNTSVRSIVQALKARNPSIVVGQYTVLNEAPVDPKNTAWQDVQFKLNQESWWLRKADGTKVQWTSEYGAWETNVTEWAKPDFNGQRYPEWIAGRDYRVYFEPIPEFELWYFDNVMWQQRIAIADWTGDGVDDFGSNTEIQAAFRRGNVAEWSTARTLAPNHLLMGNTDSDLSTAEYRGQLHGAFLEGLMGKSWSMEAQQGWRKMMERYHGTFNNLLPPKVVGFNVWGKVNDFRFFRYAFTSSLMDDGYFSYTDEKVGYSSVPWFDEYDAKLGHAVDPPQVNPWQDGVYRRRFEKGVVLANPGDKSKRVKVGSGYQRLAGKQAPDVNNGTSVNELTIPPKDGIVLVLSK